MPTTDLGIQQVRLLDVGPARSIREVVHVWFAWGLLAWTDLALKVGRFDRFYRMMRWWPLLGTAPADRRAARVREVCTAVTRARAYYFKRAWCLQSAAAATCFLRLAGIRAELVIVVRRIPFYAHAWTEVDGEVVLNDLPGQRSQFAVITRC